MENLTIETTPPKVALLDEGLNFAISSGRSWSPASASLSLRFSDTSTHYLNNYFELSLPDRDLKFYFKAAPDSSGLQLLDWQSGDSVTEFIDQTITELQKNYYINKYYNLTRSAAPGLQITAKVAGLGFDIDLKDTDIGGTFQKISANEGDEGTNPGDYKIYVAPCLYVDGQITAIPLGEDLLPPDDSMEATVNMADYLRDRIETGFNHPTSDAIVFSHADGCKRYFIRFSEYMDSALQKVLNNYTEELYVINGGLRKMDSDFLKNSGYSWWGYDLADSKFLTWAPLTKVTYPDVTERLYYLKHQSTNIKLFKQKTIAAGEQTAVEVEEIKTGAFSMTEFACGLKNLYGGEDHSLILSYKIWLEDLSSNVISEVRTFTVDQNTYLNKRTFVFRNSLGVYDTLTCVGDMSISDKVKREEVEALKDGVFRKKINLTENMPLYKISSGWLDGLYTRQWLQELLLSDDVYLLFGDMLLPVLVTTGTVNRQTDRDYMHELSFSFEPDYRENHFSAIGNPDGGDIVLADELWQILTDEADNLLRDG